MGGRKTPAPAAFGERMTKATKPVKRETFTTYRGRPLVVEIHATYITLRQKGTRRTVTLDYRTALETGYKLIARAKAMEKAKTRNRRIA